MSAVVVFKHRAAGFIRVPPRFKNKVGRLLGCIGLALAMTSLPTLMGVPAMAAGPEASGEWTKELQDADRAIQFGAEAERQSAEQALSAVSEISKNIQNLKKDVISLNKDLRLMEEQLLFPSSTKFSVFVSLDTGQFLKLESVKLKLDGKLVATHLYSDKQRDAMARGGIQKLYVTNLNEGKHSATAFFTGIGPNGRPYKRAENLEFDKGPGSGYLQIAISDDGKLQEPVFAIKQW